MTKFSILILLLIATLILSCNDTQVTSDTCDAFLCSPTKPIYAEYKVQVSLDAENPSVVIAIFRGNYEDRDTVLVDELFTKRITYDLEVDQYYSAAAYYQRDGKTYIVIDGDEVNSVYCEEMVEDCWETASGSVNLKML